MNAAIHRISMRLSRRRLGFLGLGLLLALVALSFGGPLASVGLDGADVVGPDDAGNPSAGEGATVVFRDSNGTELGRVEAMVADDPSERYTGLSDTEQLGRDEGMVFVYGDTADRTFVMRDMDFPLDIVFVAGDGTITEIAHAPVENDSDLTRYTGRAKWVVEVNRGWTTDHGVGVGDEVRVHLPE